MRRLNFYGMAAVVCMCLGMCIWTARFHTTPRLCTVDVVLIDDGAPVTFFDDADGERRKAWGRHGDIGERAWFVPWPGEYWAHASLTGQR